MAFNIAEKCLLMTSPVCHTAIFSKITITILLPIKMVPSFNVSDKPFSMKWLLYELQKKHSTSCIPKWQGGRELASSYIAETIYH